MGESVNPPHIEGYAVSYSTYANHKCRCAGCTADHLAKYKEYRERASPEVRARMNKRKTDRMKRQNSQMKVAVRNMRKRWTPEEIAVAKDPELTIKQAAEILGRTIYAVKHQRSKG